MMNQSQILSKTPSLLTPLTKLSMFREAVEYGSTRYCETKYQHQTNILTYQSGDGMTCHGWFNRGFAEKFARMARRAQKRVQFVAKKKKDVIYLGDVVIVSKYIGQTRFDAFLEKRNYQILHMTGNVDEKNLTLEVFNIGKARTEYLKYQSSRVNVPEKPNLFEQEPDNYDLTIDDDRPTRVILVTQMSQLRDKVTVWACIPTDKFDPATGIIQLSELEKICEKPITGKRPSVLVTPKQGASDNHGINVTPKKVA